MATSHYEHTQHSRFWLMAVVLYLPLTLAVIAVIVADDEAPAALLFVLAAMVLLLTLVFIGASALRVSVSAAEVRLSFRLGWPKKEIARIDIVSVEAVRYPWWYGWGIRLTPKGWMWNVWGRDAILLGLASGKTFLIGTDDIDGLAAALA